VELFVSILQHPSKARAPASTTSTASNPSNAASEADSTGFVHPLGVVPHTIRGFLSNFSNMQIVGSPYNNCSACSPSILSKYREDHWEFVRKALVEKGYVEEVSGLAEVQRKAEEMSLQVDWEDDEDGEFEEL
jgi:ubiquitin-like modifier-activating enzyme ATG7